MRIVLVAARINVLIGSEVDQCYITNEIISAVRTGRKEELSSTYRIKNTSSFTRQESPSRNRVEYGAQTKSTLGPTSLRIPPLRRAQAPPNTNTGEHESRQPE